MKKLIFLLTILFVSFAANAQEKINWLSFEEAIEFSKTTQKPFLIDIYTEWCGWCKKMDANTYSNKVITEFINTNFYAVKLNGEEKKDIVHNGKTYRYQKRGRRGYHELAASLLSNKLSYPATVFLDKEGKLIQNVPGYHPKEQFEKIIAFFSNENYKTTQWELFEKEFESKI
jgi:thioredoxin-related protein